MQWPVDSREQAGLCICQTTPRQRWASAPVDRMKRERGDQTLTDIPAVYTVRPGDDNEELRYSLRSLWANVPHSEVWIVGHRPPWVSDRVRYLPVEPHPDKYLNRRQKLRAVLPFMPETFTQWDDDFYALQPNTVTLQHQGPLAEHVARFAAIRPRAEYTLRLAHSLDVIGPGALSYEIHRPRPLMRDALAEVLDWCDADPQLQWTQAYGNVQTARGGERVTDYLGWWPDAPWSSTEDATYRAAEPFLARMFPDPSPYER